MLWRFFSLLTMAVAVRPMMDGSSNGKVSVGKKFCRLKPGTGADCVEQEVGNKVLEVFCEQNGLTWARNGDCASTEQGETCLTSEDKEKGLRFMVKHSSHLCKQ